MDTDGAEANSIRIYDDEQILELLKRTQDLENQKTSLYGIVLIAMGIAMFALHFSVGGSNFRDLCSGVLLGLSIAEMLAGLFVVAKGLAKQK